MQDITSMLVCPVCRSTELKTSPPECPACGRHFLRERGHLNLTPVPPPDADVLENWDLWEKLQANGLKSYQSAPEENLSVGQRRDALGYAKFCRLEGCLVLDVGCGPQRLEFTEPGRAISLLASIHCRVRPSGILNSCRPLRSIFRFGTGFLTASCLGLHWITS